MPFKVALESRVLEFPLGLRGLGLSGAGAFAALTVGAAVGAGERASGIHLSQCPLKLLFPQNLSGVAAWGSV